MRGQTLTTTAKGEERSAFTDAGSRRCRANVFATFADWSSNAPPLKWNCFVNIPKLREHRTGSLHFLEPVSVLSVKVSGAPVFSL